MCVIARKASTEGVAERLPLLALYCCVMTCILAGLAALPAAATEFPHRIAITLPLTGPHRALGTEIRAAIELIMADVTARSAAPGLQLTWHDDQCSSAGGLAAAQAITASAPAAVVGHACPSAAQAAAPVYAAAGIVFIASGQLPLRTATPRPTGPLHFRMQASGEQGSIIGATLAETGPETRIAFVRDKTQFAQTVLQAAAAALSARKRSPALTETFAGGDKDFAALAQRIKAAGITHIALAAFPSEASLLVAEIKKVDPSIVFIAADTLADPAFARAGGLATNGVQVVLAPDIRAHPFAQDFANRLTAGSTTPNRAAIASVAALEVLNAALPRMHGSTLAERLAGGRFETILGSVGFDTTGTVSLPSHVVYTWSNGVLHPPAAR
jgi:branched-chain amino acid transport system substrate-binding protein